VSNSSKGIFYRTVSDELHTEKDGSTKLQG